MINNYSVILLISEIKKLFDLRFLMFDDQCIMFYNQYIIIHVL